MLELMDLLGNYSRPSLMDDYYAVKAMIEMENEDHYNLETENDDQKSNDNNTNNNNINDQKPKLNETRAYFQSTLGQCSNFSNCNSFVRNRRPRSSDSITNERREAFYIRAEVVQKYKNAGHTRFETKEVILQSSLDIIHNYIFHAKDEEMNVNQSHQSKFVTEVEMEENDSKNGDGNQVNMSQYSFGIDTDYWLKTHPCFVPAKYPDLKTELTSNSLHPITLLAYEALEEQARDILQTEYGKSLKSRREFFWMKIDGKQWIPMGSLINERHLISVLSYTNFGKMQYEFKKHGFRKMNDNEKEIDVRKRNAEIAHWSRAIYEVIQCWGSVMSRKTALFHGISCKLLFKEFSTTFSMPTSLTTNVRIAQNFAKENGIILVLKHAQERDNQSLMFDVSLMSDFPNEEERLICHSKVQFYDILMDGRSLKQWMKVLRIYERIRFGEFLSHISFSVQEQEIIVHMIENYLEDRKSKSEKNAEFYENGNIPNYIQICFNECTGDYMSVFLVNPYAIKRAIANEKLLQYLDGSQNGKNSEFLSIFKNVRTAHVYEWLVTGKAYESYFADSHPWVIDDRIQQLNLAEGSQYKPLYLKFHWQLKNGENGKLWCALKCDSFPTEVDNVAINLGIFVNETKSETSIGAHIFEQKLYAAGLSNIVDSKKLLMENNSEMSKSEFTVKVYVIIASYILKKRK